MAPRNPKSRPKGAPEVPFDPPKIKKRRVQNTTIATRGLPGRACKKPYVKKYKNGLLNLEVTPLHLVPVTKRNATDSPLLRLPAEIRNAIWHYTISNKPVNLSVSKPGGGPNGEIIYLTTDQQPLDSTSESEHRVSKKDHSAFHLPKLCRQIYSETASLVYSQSMFTFGSEYYLFWNDITRLRPFQKEAVQSIKLSLSALWSCSNDRRRSQFSTLTFLEYKPFKKTFFPNLKRIIVDISDVQHILRERDRQHLSDEDAVDWLTRVMQQREGSDVAVKYVSSDSIL